MKMNRKTKKIASNFVCIVTALSLVFLQTPVSYATAGADEAAQAVASQAEKASQVDELAVQAADDDGSAAEETSKVEAAKAEPAGGADAKATDAAADAKKATDAEQAKGDAADKATKAGEDAKPAAEAKPETADGAAKATDAKSDDAKAAGEGETAEAAKDASGKEESKDADAGDKTKADAEDAAKESASEEDAGKDTAADAKSETAKDEADAKDDAKGEKAEKPATQRVYTYEDAQLKVTATLDKASAISDDAELKVTAITAKSEDYNYDAYLAALNEDAGEEDAFTADNTLLYDVAFLVKDDDGKVVEVQPESGSVKVQFEFKKDQLAKQLDAQEADDVQVVHLPLKDSAKADTTAEATNIAVTDVKVEKLDADVNVEDGTLSLKAQEFSVFAMAKVIAKAASVESSINTVVDGDVIDVELDLGRNDSVNFIFVDEAGNPVNITGNYYLFGSVNGTLGENNGQYFAHLVKLKGSSGITVGNETADSWYTFERRGGGNALAQESITGETAQFRLCVNSQGDNQELSWGPYYDGVAAQAKYLKAGDALGDYVIKEIRYTTDYKQRYYGDDYHHLDKTVTVTLADKPAVNVSIKLMDYDGVTPYAPSSLEGNYYLRVKATKGGEDYYAVKPITLQGNSQVDVTVKGFAKSTDNVNGGATADTYPYDSDFTITDISVVTSTNLYNYETAEAASRIVPGFTFVANSFNTDNNPEAVSIVLKRSYETEFVARVQFSPDGSAPITADDKVYLFVDVDHETSGHTYYLQRLTTDGSDSLEFAVDTWHNGNGGALPNEKFTGNERSVVVRLLTTTKDELSYNMASNASDCTVVSEGASVKAYTVSYNDTREFEKDDINHLDKYVYTVTLNRNEATKDYTFRSILGPGVNYGITADHFEQKMHMQTNLATNLYTNPAGENATEPDLNGTSSGAFAIAEFDGDSQLFLGTRHAGNVLFYADETMERPLKDDRDFVYIVKDSRQNISNNIVEPIISHGDSISEELLHHSATIVPVAPKDTNTPVQLDTTAYAENATIYVDADNIAAWLEKGGGLRITKHPDQLIVFNFKNTDQVYINEFYVKYPDMSPYSQVPLEEGYIKTDSPTTQGPKNDALSEISQHVVWNLASCTFVELNASTGMFLVPRDDSTTDLRGTTSGWIISDGFVKNTGGEWHSVYTDLSDVDVATLYASKKVDGRDANGNQKFVFQFEHYVNGKWEKPAQPDAGKVENDGSAISCVIQP